MTQDNKPAAERTSTEKLSEVKKSNLLYSALRSGETARLDAALENNPKLDADNGRALRLCAEKNDYSAAKKLMLAGADISYALQCHEKQMEFDKSPAANSMLTNLQQYRTAMETEIRPNEQIRLLREILTRQIRLEKEMEDFKKAMSEITDPAALDKPEMKAPASSKKPTTPKGQKP